MAFLLRDSFVKQQTANLTTKMGGHRRQRSLLNIVKVLVTNGPFTWIEKILQRFLTLDCM